MLKPPFATLRENGHLSVVYVDDSILMGETYLECSHNIADTVSILTSLGFYIHPVKSVLVPTQEITFLGFVLNSVNMTISLTNKKKQKIHDMAIEILNSREVCIRKLASFIGNIVASFPAVPYGRLYYRYCEHEKVIGVAIQGSYDGVIHLSKRAIDEIRWWKCHIMESFASLEPRPVVDKIVYSDASNLGWGIHSEDNEAIGGRWTPQELELHSNITELKAASLTVMCYSEGYKHIRVMTDSSTAVKLHQ